VVDDDQAMRENLSECLASEGYVCWLEASADDALRRLELEWELPDVILLDLRMPGMTAAEFFSRMKERPIWATVPIVLMTGACEDQIPSGLPTDAVLVRPFAISHLLDLLNGVVEGGATVPSIRSYTVHP